ncbi:AB17A protein, partial [Tichodroma muraria]|nr:AB17A protein [Tichodroma muraria]
DELFLCLSLAARPVGPRGQSPSRKLSHGDVTAVCSLSVTPGQIFCLAETWSLPVPVLCHNQRAFPGPFPKGCFGGRKSGNVSFPVLTLLSPLFPIHPLGSIEKISKITSPVLIIHGTEDEVIDFSHGLALFERCPKAVEPLWVDGAGHNDIELYSQYLERLRKFISQELASQRN